MKLHPPGPSRARAQRRREGLGVALAEDWECGKAVGSDGLGRVTRAQGSCSAKGDG